MWSVECGVDLYIFFTLFITSIMNRPQLIFYFIVHINVFFYRGTLELGEIAQYGAKQKTRLKVVSTSADFV